MSLLVEPRSTKINSPTFSSDSKYEDRKYVMMANRLLQQLGLCQGVTNLEDIGASIFIPLYEGLVGEPLNSLIPSPDCYQDDLYNLQMVINSLSSNVLHVSLSHIKAVDILAGKKEAIYNLVQIFQGLMEYIIRRLEEDPGLHVTATPESQVSSFVGPLPAQLTDNRLQVGSGERRTQSVVASVAPSDVTKSPTHEQLTLADLSRSEEDSFATPFLFGRMEDKLKFHICRVQKEAEAVGSLAESLTASIDQSERTRRERNAFLRGLLVDYLSTGNDVDLTPTNEPSGELKIDQSKVVLTEKKRIEPVVKETVLTKAEKPLSAMRKTTCQPSKTDSQTYDRFANQRFSTQSSSFNPPDSDRKIAGRRLESDRKFSGERPDSDRKIAGSRLESNRNFSGERPDSDRKVAESRLKFDRKISGNRPDSDRKVAGSRLESDRKISGNRPDSDRKVAGSGLESDRKISGNRPDSDRKVAGSRSDADFVEHRPDTDRKFTGIRPDLSRKEAMPPHGSRSMYPSVEDELSAMLVSVTSEDWKEERGDFLAYLVDQLADVEVRSEDPDAISSQEKMANPQSKTKLSSFEGRSWNMSRPVPKSIDKDAIQKQRTRTPSTVSNKQRRERERKIREESVFRQRAKILNRSRQQELVYERLLREALKSRRGHIGPYDREKIEVSCRRTANEIEALERFYQDRFSLLTESLEQERREIELRDRAQEQELKRMKRELRQDRITEIRSAQDAVLSDHGEAYFRELDARRLFHNLGAGAGTQLSALRTTSNERRV